MALSHEQIENRAEKTRRIEETEYRVKQEAKDRS